MANTVPAAIKEKFTVSPLLPNKFNYKTHDYVSENLSMEQAEMLCADSSFEFIQLKKEKPVKTKEAKK